tara:strand:+ start:227 stop:373 length:147 start_codon:yes stop_codon:yes gene_type:complete
LHDNWWYTLHDNWWYTLGDNIQLAELALASFTRFLDGKPLLEVNQKKM